MNLHNPRACMLEFIIKERAGEMQADAAYRAYDLDKGSGDHSLSEARLVLNMELSEVAAYCHDADIEPPTSGELVRWLGWYRIARGYSKRRPLRKAATPAPSCNTDQAPLPPASSPDSEEDMCEEEIRYLADQWRYGMNPQERP